MEHLFYSFAIAVIFWELLSVLNPSRLREYSKHSKAKKEGRTLSDQTEHKMVAVGCFALMYLVWNLAGLFGSQWVFFLVLLGLGVFTGLFKKLVPTAIQDFITVIDALLTIALVVAMIIDKYHFNLI